MNIANVFLERDFMKKAIPIIGALLMIALGVILPRESFTLRIILVLIGIVFILSWWIYSLRGKAMVCPSCQRTFTWKLPLVVKKQIKMIQCPHCGALLQTPRKEDNC